MLIVSEFPWKPGPIIVRLTIDLTLADVLRMPTLNLKFDIGADVGVGVKQSIGDSFATA